MIRLVDNWHTAHRWLSVQLGVLVALLAAGYDYVPAIRETLPEGWAKWAIMAILIARVIKQEKPA